MAYTSTLELSDLLGHPVKLLLNNTVVVSQNPDKMRTATRYLRPGEAFTLGYASAGQAVSKEQVYVGVVRDIITPQQHFENGGIIVANTTRPHFNLAIPETIIFFDAACIGGYHKLAIAPKEYHLQDRPID